MVKTWPELKGCWPPTFGDEKVTLNHLVYNVYLLKWNQPDGRSWTIAMEVSGFIPWITAMFSRLSFAQSLGASFDAAFRVALARAAGNAGGHALAIPERFGGGGPMTETKMGSWNGTYFGGKSKNAKLMVISRDFTYEWTLIHGIDILACIKTTRLNCSCIRSLPFPWISKHQN